MAVAVVVMIDAPIKNNIKNGNTCFMDTFSAPSPSVFRARKNASTNVIGMIASVLVNFTVTALSKVALPNPYMLSHVDAAAVTDEVSLTAVPAKIPNASPEVCENPSIVPSVGNKIAASTLKKK